MAEVDDLGERVAQLEQLAAYQEQTNDALSEAVQRQDKEIAALNREIARLRGQIETIGTHPALASEDEPPPPHY